MSIAELVILLIAGVLGSLGVTVKLGNTQLSVGWLVFTLWMVLKLLRLL